MCNPPSPKKSKIGKTLGQEHLLLDKEKWSKVMQSDEIHSICHSITHDIDEGKIELNYNPTKYI